jgi:hypothetical protein
MNCDEVMEWMQRDIDHELTVAEKEAMKAHMQSCPDCAEMYARLLLLSQELASLPKVTPPVSLVDSILPKLDELDRSGSGPFTAAASTAIQTMETAPAPVLTLAQERPQRFKSLWSAVAACGIVAAGLLLVLFVKDMDTMEVADDTRLLYSPASSQSTSGGSGPGVSQFSAQSGVAAQEMAKSDAPPAPPQPSPAESANASNASSPTNSAGTAPRTGEATGSAGSTLKQTPTAPDTASRGSTTPTPQTQPQPQMQPQTPASASTGGGANGTAGANSATGAGSTAGAGSAAGANSTGVGSAAQGNASAGSAPEAKQPSDSQAVSDSAAGSAAAGSAPAATPAPTGESAGQPAATSDASTEPSGSATANSAAERQQEPLGPPPPSPAPALTTSPTASGTAASSAADTSPTASASASDSAKSSLTTSADDAAAQEKAADLAPKSAASAAAESSATGDKSSQTDSSSRSGLMAVPPPATQLVSEDGLLIAVIDKSSRKINVFTADSRQTVMFLSAAWKESEEAKLLKWKGSAQLTYSITSADGKTRTIAIDIAKQTEEVQQQPKP